MVRQIKLPSSYRAAAKSPTWSVPPLLPHQKQPWVPASNSLQQGMLAGSIIVSSPVSILFQSLEECGDGGSRNNGNGWGDIVGAGGGENDGDGGFNEWETMYFDHLDADEQGGNGGHGDGRGDGGAQAWGEDS